MNIKNSIITAIRALTRNKLRSALTSVGIIIGISSVIVMIGLGNSARIEVRNKVVSYGDNALKIKSKIKELTVNDVNYLKKSYSQVRFITPVLQRNEMLIKFRDKKMRSEFYGVDNDFFVLMGRNIKDGRLFHKNDILSMSKVVITGQTNRKKLFENDNPIGKVILIENIPFTVIGVLEEKGESFNNVDYDDVFIVPYTTAGTRFWNKKSFPEIYIATHTESMMYEMKEIIRKYLRRKHGIVIGKEDDFTITSSKDKLQVANEISSALSILLAGIASISLFVGGVGIMNIMLVSVTERTREIGIRMAIGAKRKDIMTQFLIESVTLSLIGGIIGVTLGIGIYYIITTTVEWVFIFSFFSILISVLFAAAVGIFFGYYPARKASSLKPIDALKFE